MNLRQYDETLEYRVLPNGTRVLLPAAVDLALARAHVDTVQRALTLIETEAEPPEVSDARADLRTDLIAEERTRLSALVDGWTQGQMTARGALRRALALAETTLAQLERIRDTDLGTLETEVYVMRYIGYDEEMEAQAEFPDMPDDEETTARNREKRNRLLLGNTLIGMRAVVSGDALKPATEIELSNLETRVLIGRMWTTNTMSPQLLDYFR